MASIVLGCLIGKLANRYFLHDDTFEPLIVVACGLGMTTNIQLNVAHNLSDYLDIISSNYVKD
jgi:hypothetical protein